MGQELRHLQQDDFCRRHRLHCPHLAACVDKIQKLAEGITDITNKVGTRRVPTLFLLILPHLNHIFFHVLPRGTSGLGKKISAKKRRIGKMFLRKLSISFSIIV
jgi:hypothetical protein